MIYCEFIATSGEMLTIGCGAVRRSQRFNRTPGGDSFGDFPWNNHVARKKHEMKKIIKFK